MEVKCVCKLEKNTSLDVRVRKSFCRSLHTTLTYTLQVDKGVAMYIRLPPAEKSFAFRQRYTVRSFSNGKWFMTLACLRFTWWTLWVCVFWIDYCSIQRHRVVSDIEEGLSKWMVEFSVAFSKKSPCRTKRVWKIRRFMIGTVTVAQ